MAKTYDIGELAKLLSYAPGYLKMILKKVDGYEDGKPVPEDVAKRTAEKLSRRWPPENA